MKLRSILLVALVYLGFTGNAQNIDSGMVLFLPFSGNANDYSGNNNHGSVNGATLSEDAFGNDSCAYSFDGSGDYISISNFGAVIPEDEITVAFWTKINKVKSQNVYFLVPNSNSNRFSGEIFYSHNGVSTTFMDHGNIGGGGRLAINNTTFNSDWHHYTYISSKSGGYQKLYEDGTLTKTVNSSTSFNQVQNKDLQIGGSASLYLDGYVDEFRVYNRVLSQSEIDSLQTATSCGLAGVHDVHGEELKASLYPNPNNGSFTIYIPDANNTNPYSYSVFNAAGQEIASGDVSSVENKLQLADVNAKGYYTVKLYNESSFKTFKLLIH